MLYLDIMEFKELLRWWEDTVMLFNLEIKNKLIATLVSRF